MNYSRSENDKRKRGHKSQSKKLYYKVLLLGLRVLLAVAVIGVFAGAGAVVGAYLGILENAPTIGYIQRTEGNFTTILYLDSTGEEIDRFDGGENREYVSIDNIPKNLSNAFVAIEDERFFTHNGIDIEGMFRALYATLTTSGKQGASTITQQLIKNKLGYMRNTIDSKLQEQYLAVKYEKELADALGSKELAKSYILELYLNAVPLSAGQIGVQAASLYYFGKDCSELTLSECAVMAAITQRPEYYNPVRNPQNNILRRNSVLDNMLKLGFITEAEYNQAINEDVYATISEVNAVTLAQPSYHSYFNDAVFESVLNDLMEQKGMTKSEATNLIYNGGLSIYTTQDTRIQEIVDEAYLDESNFPSNEYALSVEFIVSVRNNVTGKTTSSTKKTTVKTQEEADAFAEKVRNDVSGLEKEIVAEKMYIVVQPQSAFAIIDNETGYVRAIAGGRGEKVTNRGFNRATDAYRSPGSVFKVLASYTPAIDTHMLTAASIIDDVPTKIGTFEPNNWDKNNPFKGLTTVREAIRDSMNICAAKTMYNVGVNTSLDYLHKYGFTSLVADDYNLSTALGGLTNGVLPVELAAAYAAIGNEGYYNKPVFYTKVLDHEGNVLLENTPQPEQIMRKTTAYILLDIMKDVVRAGTGTAARFSTVNMPVAGKTGTTSDDKDLCFVGVTPYYTASIWLGYDTQKTMRNYGSVHTKLWSKIMEEIHRDLPYKDFVQPNGITTAVICMESGQLVGELCRRDPRGDRTRSEIFEIGTQPLDTCTVHRAYNIDTSTGMLAGPNCPSESIEYVVGIVRPVPYEGEKREMIADVKYEFSESVLNGEECTLHSHGYIPDIPDDIIDTSDIPYNPDFPDEPNNMWPQQTPSPVETFNPYFYFTEPPVTTPFPTEELYNPAPTDEPPEVTIRP